MFGAHACTRVHAHTHYATDQLSANRNTNNKQTSVHACKNDLIK